MLCYYYKKYIIIHTLIFAVLICIYIFTYLHIFKGRNINYSLNLKTIKIFDSYNT